MSKALWIIAGGLVAAGAAGVFAYAGRGGAGTGTEPAPDSPTAPTEAGAPVEPADARDKAPTLVGTLSDMAERRRRALERASAEFGAAKDLFGAGQTKEAAALLAAIRERAPGFLDDASRAKDAARIEGAARAIEAERKLLDVLAAQRLTAEQREGYDRQLAATAEILAKAANEDELDRLSRHLKRFLLPDGAAGSADSKDWADVQLRAFVEDRRTRRAGDKKPPVSDADAAEARRLEELEKLRQRDAVGLLDSIHAGLAWLAIHQRDDGSFCDAATVERCAALKHAPTCLDKWPNTGDAFAIANTSLVLVAFLDFRDQDPLGWFDPYLGRGLQWLLKQQKPDGSFPGTGQNYSTAMAIMALAQATSSTGADDVREATRRGIAYLASIIGPTGGFKYGRNEPGDLSVTGWVAQAVEQARAAGIEIPLQLSAGLETFFTYVWVQDGGPRFTYMYRREERPALSPVGMLLGHLVGKDRDTALLQQWKDYLKSLSPDRNPGLYALYYGVRVSILLNGTLEDPWRKWTFDLANRQVHGNVASGSFPGDLWRWSGGVTTQTAVAVLTLEHSLYLR